MTVSGMENSSHFRNVVSSTVVYWVIITWTATQVLTEHLLLALSGLGIFTVSSISQRSVIDMVRAFSLLCCIMRRVGVWQELMTTLFSSSHTVGCGVSHICRPNCFSMQLIIL